MMDETDLALERKQMRPVRRALCRCGAMLMLNASGYVVAQSDRGMWVTVALPVKDCPRCGADLDTSDRVTVVP